MTVDQHLHCNRCYASQTDMPLYRCRMCAYHNVVRTGAVSVIRGKRRKEKWCNYFATLMPTRTHKRAACSATNTSSLSDGLVAPCAGSKSSKEDETDAFFSHEIGLSVKRFPWPSCTAYNLHQVGKRHVQAESGLGRASW